MKAARIALVAAVILVAGPVPRALACWCIPVSATERIARADVVFVGIVVEQRWDGAPFSSAGAWRFDVERVDKGPARDGITVRSDAATDSCSFAFAPGARYRVFANGADGHFETDLCAGNQALSARATATQDPSVRFEDDAGTRFGGAGTSRPDGGPIAIALIALAVASAVIARARGARSAR